MQIPYTKHPITIAEQITELKRRGLLIVEDAQAEKILGEVSYFRLAAYLRPMESDKENHYFKAGSTFDNAIGLYEFDIELRQLIFDAIQRIEVALRAKIIQAFSLSHGPFWFMDVSLFDNESKFHENLKTIEREVKRSKEEFIREHFKKYSAPEFPPAWKTLELLSFGTLSKLYYNFSDNKQKKLVARQFNLPQHEVLESWMRSLAALRNYCAHHARIWNRFLNATPQMNAHLRGEWVSYSSVDSNKLYAILCCIAYWLDSMGRGYEFKMKLRSLLSFNSSVDMAAMGFPKDWLKQPLWQKVGTD